MNKILILNDLSISVAEDPFLIKYINSIEIKKTTIKSSYESLIIIDDLFETFNTFIDDNNKFVYHKFNEPIFSKIYNSHSTLVKEINFFKYEGKFRFVIVGQAKTDAIDKNIINKLKRLGKILRWYKKEITI